MKKILIVADTYFPKIDGIMRFLQEVIPRIAHSFDITLLVPNLGKSWFHKEIKLKVSHIIQLSGYSNMAIRPSNFRKIRNAVRAADTIFVQGPALISALAVYYGRKYNKTVIHYPHLIMWELYEKHIPRWTRCCIIPILKRLTIRWYNKCDLLVLPYKNLSRELSEQGVTSKKVVARLGVDTTRFIPPKDKDEAKRKLGIDASYTVVGYVGRISKEKNVPVLGEAIKRIHNEYKVILLIVGSGQKHEMKYLQNVKNVMLPGFKHNVVPYLQAMDIFVMPSLTETTSLATLEAMACGIPVITTKVGFLREYVIKDYNGLLFPKGNVYTLVLQLRKLLKNKKLRQLIGLNARSVALGFSWDKTAARIKDVLERY